MKDEEPTLKKCFEESESKSSENLTKEELGTEQHEKIKKFNFLGQARSDKICFKLNFVLTGSQLE